jgi:DNA-directed RNA polymerase specialized sigma24 family protein
MENDEYLPEQPRDLLAHAIIASLQSWPELQRRIFVEVRYCGKSAQEVAVLFGLPVAEVIHTLEQCELRLYRALRNQSHTPSPQISEVPSQPQVYSAGCCFR